MESSFSDFYLAMDKTAFSYRAIVFRLKGGVTLEDSLPVKKLLKYRSVIISKHPANNDDDCEWNDLHYHGIVESDEKYRFDSDRVFNQIRNEHCEWFKSEQCKLPVNFIAYMQLPPREMIFRNERNENSDLSLLESQVTDDLVQQVRERKQSRINAKREGNNDIMIIKDLILKSGAQSEAELLTEYHADPTFETLYCKRTFSTNFKKALNFAIQTTLDKEYLELCAAYQDKKGQCMTPYRSANLMEQWLKYQQIDPKKFCDEIVTLMDHKARKQNTLILKGSPNSGKTFIAKSIEKACIFYGEISQCTGGYAFLWQDCVNKRVIVINEPFFDNCMIETLKVILEGTGTFVHKKNCSDEYLTPTPILITSNNDVWVQCPNAEEAIRARCLNIYDKLKPCPFLKLVRKDLHPRWLNILLIRYASEAPPLSDISDDEICRTGRATDTADLVQTSDVATQTEDLSINSTPTAVDTTLTSPTEYRKRKLTKDLSPTPPKKACSETSSQELFTEIAFSDSSQEENFCPVKPHLRLQKQTYCRKPITIFQSSDEESQEIPENLLSGDFSTIPQTPSQVPETPTWKQTHNKLQQEECLQEEEEDKFRCKTQAQ